jgi:hypothetical protein
VKPDYLSFGIKENRYSIDGTMISLGEIDIKDMSVSTSGDFVLYLGGKTDSKNFLQLPENANMLIVRQTYKDRISQIHATINIKALNSDVTPELLTPKKLETQLNQSLAFVSGTAKTFLQWVHEFKTHHRNKLPLGDQSFFQAAGGDPKFVICMVIMNLRKMNLWKLQPIYLNANIGIFNWKIIGWNHWIIVTSLFT